MLEVNIKDEATNTADVEVPKDSINDLDLTEDIVADEFVLLEDNDAVTPTVTDDSQTTDKDDKDGGDKNDK